MGAEEVAGAPRNAQGRDRWLMHGRGVRWLQSLGRCRHEFAASVGKTNFAHQWCPSGINPAPAPKPWLKKKPNQKSIYCFDSIWGSEGLLTSAGKRKGDVA